MDRFKDSTPATVSSLIRKPSAWIPIAIPLAFFAYLVTDITLNGIVRNEDEGTGAHLFQLWLVLEPLMVGFFAVKWLPRAQQQTFIILALQILVALFPVSVVFLLGL